MADQFPTSQNFYDAEKDLRTVSAVSNSRDPDTGVEIDSWQTRTGGQTDTIKGRLDKLGLVVIGSTTTGCVLSNVNEVVLHTADGGWYSWGGTFPHVVAPGTDPTLPASGYIVRSSLLTAAQAREALRRTYAEVGYNLVDGSFQAGFTLANSNDVALDEATGKAYSGVAGTYPAGTSTAGFVDESSKILMTKRILPISSYGAVEDSVSDETDAVHRAMLSGYVNLSDGVIYNVTSLPDIHNSLKVRGKGTIVCGSKIRLTGSISQVGDLGVPASIGAPSITLSSTVAGVEAGDVLIIHDTAISSFSRHRDFYTKGEYITVKGVSGATITLESTLRYGYTAAASTKILKPEHILVDIEEAEFTGGDAGSVLEIMLARDVNIDCNTLSEVGNASLSIDRCFNVKLAGNHRCTAPSDQQQYGAVVRSSWNVLSLGATYHGSRHGFATGGATGDGYIQSNNVVVFGGETSSETSHSSDFHGNIENSHFINVNHKNGVCLAGKNTSAVGGAAVCGLANTPVLGTREIVGGTIRFNKLFARQTNTRSPIGQFSTSESVAIDETFDVEFDDINLDLSAAPDQYISRLTFATDAAVKFGLRFNNIKINGVSDISGFLLLGAPNLGRMSQLTINDIHLNGLGLTGDGWTRNAALYSVAGETRWTLPTWSASVTATIPSGSQVSPEAQILVPVASKEQKWHISTSVDGISSGSSPYLLPFVGRAHTSNDIRVRLWSLLGTVASDTTEVVSVTYGIRDRLYSSSLVPS